MKKLAIAALCTVFTVGAFAYENYNEAMKAGMDSVKIGQAKMAEVWKLLKEEKVEDHDAALEVINKLSKSLKEELLLNANGIILRNFPLFQNNFSDNTLRKLIYEMKEINMTPGDIIYHQNDVLDPSIFIIRKGIVELFVPHS